MEKLPDELMDLVRCYQQSRILLTAVELDVFTAIAESKKLATAEELAAVLGTDRRGIEVLLNALVALGVLTKQADVFANTPVARQFLVAGSPDDASMALKHNLSLWRTWSTLTDCVRAGHTVTTREMPERGDDWTVPFIAAMHRNASQRASLVVKAVGTSGVNRLLDVGGGSGAYSIAFAKANPALRAEVFDLPTVLPIASKHIAEAGLSDRVGTRQGDLRKDDFGTGYDLVLVSAICHMLSPDENRDLFRRIFRALAAAGRLVVQDHIMDPDKTTPRAGALFAVNMLVGTRGGSTYSEDEYAGWLSGSGFTPVRKIQLSGPNDLMVGEKRPVPEA